MPSSSSSAYKSKRYTIEELLEPTHCDCPRPSPVKEQISWTKKNPSRRFKACPIYQPHLETLAETHNMETLAYQYQTHNMETLAETRNWKDVIISISSNS
ncbi:hypothetical protein Tco_1044240, partial [Tanacetum coccineum]